MTKHKMQVDWGITGISRSVKKMKNWAKERGGSAREGGPTWEVVGYVMEIMENANELADTARKIEMENIRLKAQIKALHAAFAGKEARDTLKTLEKLFRSTGIKFVIKASVKPE